MRAKHFLKCSKTEVYIFYEDNTLPVIGGENMSDESSERLMTRQEVEERFGISKRFLEISAMQKMGPALVRIGRSINAREKILFWLPAESVWRQFDRWSMN